MNPTPEQADAVLKFRGGGDLKINAFAGTGKTTTLRMLAESTRRRGMYLAFNKSIANDAATKFSSNTNCSTVHSIAYRATPRAFQQGDKMTGSINANAAAKHLNYGDRYIEGVRLTARSRGHLTLETLQKFMQGGLCQADLRHVPLLGKMDTLSPAALNNVKSGAVEGAHRLWRRMINPQDALPLGHDGYLKLWALSRPQLAADFILLDEAQDTNPVVLEVLRRQQAQIVYVGDRHQQIYEWRGAVNAMQIIKTPNETFLTTSFRFGERIANAASHVIGKLGETRPLSGNVNTTSFLGCDESDAIISRTNASVISGVISALDAGRKPYIIGGARDLIRLLRGVEELKRGEPSHVDEFFGFENWAELVEHSQTPEGQRLKTFVGLVTQHGEGRLIQRLNETAQDERSGDVVLSTAHKAKGREWDTVTMTDDFLPTKFNRDENAPPEFDPAEVRLFYVALTRARTAIEVSPAFLAHFGVDAGPRLPSRFDR